jgi:hypothetical protein
LSGDLDVEEKRFVARQLLFRSQNMIRESEDDLSSLVNDLNNSIAKIAPESVRENWETLFAYHRGIQRKLIKRIERRLAEMDSIDLSVQNRGKYESLPFRH